MGAKYLLALFIFVLFSGAASAQTFDSEKDIGKPVKVPAGILGQLKKTGLIQGCMETSEEKFSASWFQAAIVNLNNDGRADYIVKNTKDCLNGPRAASWWIFRGSANGFTKVFDESVLMLTIKRVKTAGFYDIETETTMMNIIRNTWKFDGRKYKLARTKIIEVG
ncbi:MAG TPA: hypothetical protein VGO50_09390 [Pyrinomonadaceae bacterium]|jgi:hypothetical protein|nr:hypothetical protein [Pyrinomonadaceae bacterium]